MNKIERLKYKNKYGLEVNFCNLYLKSYLVDLA
jgi:hypothetical protein